MDLQTFMGLVRAVLAFAGGWAVNKGYLSADDMTTIAGAAVAAASAAWSVAHHTSANRAIEATAGEVTTPQAIKKRIAP